MHFGIPIEHVIEAGTRKFEADTLFAAGARAWRHAFAHTVLCLSECQTCFHEALEVLEQHNKDATA